MIFIILNQSLINYMHYLYVKLLYTPKNLIDGTFYNAIFFLLYFNPFIFILFCIHRKRVLGIKATSYYIKTADIPKTPLPMVQMERMIFLMNNNIFIYNWIVPFVPIVR